MLIKKLWERWHHLLDSTITEKLWKYWLLSWGSCDHKPISQSSPSVLGLQATSSTTACGSSKRSSNPHVPGRERIAGHGPEQITSTSKTTRMWPVENFTYIHSAHMTLPSNQQMEAPRICLRSQELTIWTWQLTQAEVCSCTKWIRRISCGLNEKLVTCTLATAAVWPRKSKNGNAKNKKSKKSCCAHTYADDCLFTMHIDKLTWVCIIGFPSRNFAKSGWLNRISSFV